MKNIHLTIIIGLILLVLGVGVGFLLGISEKSEVNIKPTLIPELTAQERKIKMLLEHESLDNINANIIGEVVKISENIITITHNEDQLELKIDFDHIHLNRLIWTEPGLAPISEVIEFDQVQPGESVRIDAFITEQGELTVHGITIQPVIN